MTAMINAKVRSINGNAYVGLNSLDGHPNLFNRCERKVDWEGVVRHYDIVHPITAEVRVGLTETVLGEYRRQLEGSNENQAQEK